MSKVPEHFFRQAAVLPYRISEQGLEILLITSRRGRRWVLPKGVREAHLGSRRSAVKEALEEAGIEGRVGARPLGSYRYEKWGGVCRVQVFTMEVQVEHQDWPERHRQRAWLTPSQALARVDEAQLRQLIRGFAEGFGKPPRATA